MCYLRKADDVNEVCFAYRKGRYYARLSNDIPNTPDSMLFDRKTKSKVCIREREREREMAYFVFTLHVRKECSVYMYDFHMIFQRHWMACCLTGKHR